MADVKIYDGEKFVNFNISNGIELPVGFEYYVPYSELDSGQLIRDGQIVSRSVYKDLWDFVQKHPSLLLTEEQWQAELSANEGIVNNYYSSGDGSTTFRLPKAGVIELPVITAEGLNKFSTDSFKSHNHENITEPISGKILNPIYWNTTDNGAILNNANIKSQNSGSLTPYFAPLSGTNITNVGGTETKPKTITKLAVVQAFGRVINTGTLDINDLVNDVNNLIQSNHIKTYTDLTQIGLTNGIEQFQDIGKNLPENSQITYRVWEKDNHNHVLYPSISGIFTMEKAITFCRCFYNSITPNKQWQMAFDYRDEFYIEPTWELLAKNNKLSMPSNNKIIINLKNQGDSWTAPCDGYIWGMKIGGSDVVNSWLNVWDSTDADTSNYGTLIYCDYGQPYINLCGNLAVRKGQTVYFNWNNNCRVYFYPALNNNMPVYGEDVRIYIKAININGYPVKGANVEITISSGHTENGKTNNDGRYLLSYAGYKKIKNANISSGDMPKVMDVKVSSNEGSDVLTLYNLEELQENKIYDLEIHIV
jgi:hypothetical protein